LVSLEAAAGFVLAALCCLYLIQIALEASTAARKVGGLALAVVCGGLALEALLYLSQAPPVGGSFTRSVAVLFVRSSGAARARRRGVSALSIAVERRDWQLVSIYLLLGVSEAAAKLPPESLTALLDLLGGAVVEPRRHRRGR
jgi:hypothetical protein